MPSASAASVPGRIRSHNAASRADCVGRGSTTIDRAPFFCASRTRWCFEPLVSLRLTPQSRITSAPFTSVKPG